MTVLPDALSKRQRRAVDVDRENDKLNKVSLYVTL